MRKKTHDEYVAEVAIKNPDIEVVEEYVNAKTPIMHRCKIHNVYWKALPGNVLAGKGCKECMKDKNRNHFMKSHEDYIAQINDIVPYIVALDKYQGNNVPILHLCTKHNVKWMAYPANILKGEGCLECGKEKFHDKRCKKHEDYVEQLAVANPTVEVIEEYMKDGYYKELQSKLKKFEITKNQIELEKKVINLSDIFDLDILDSN